MGILQFFSLVLSLSLWLQDPDAARKEDPEFDADHAQERLNEVYERMSVIAGSTAESRASKILHGLGFTDKMQKRSTQSFRRERIAYPLMMIVQKFYPPVV